MALAKTKAVSSAKLIAQGQKSGSIPANLPHAGTILVGEQQKSGNKKHSANGLQTTFVSKADWNFDMDAGLLTDGITTGLLVYYRETIMGGEKPDGSGAQRPLNPKTLRSKFQRRSKLRGYKTGFFADNIRRNKITGTTTKAQSTILPPTNRNVFIAEEAKRGNSYFSIQGTAAEVIKEITDKFIEGGIVGKNRAPDLSSKNSGTTP